MTCSRLQLDDFCMAIVGWSVACGRMVQCGAFDRFHFVRFKY